MATPALYLKAAEVASRDAAALIATTDADERVCLMASRHAQARRSIVAVSTHSDLTEEAAANLATASGYLEDAMTHLSLDPNENARTRRFLDGADELISCARTTCSAALNERLDREAAEREKAAAARTVRTPEQLAAQDAEEVRELVRVGVKELLKSLPGLNRFKRTRAAN
ncbi:hypothetical protein ACIQV3_35820 [Streptomyces sp. NPDC099050]|uniref:hypothetical protein n=1 Tax=Streptomyces sp. NPDC099050 TaxID=3366100 RepID=UPI00381EAD9D